MTDDPIRDFNAWDKQQNSKPMITCDVCGKPVDDYYYEIDTEIYCEWCMAKIYRKENV